MYIFVLLVTIIHLQGIGGRGWWLSIPTTGLMHYIKLVVDVSVSIVDCDTLRFSHAFAFARIVLCGILNLYTCFVCE